jgi:hypothetical protein
MLVVNEGALWAALLHPTDSGSPSGSIQARRDCRVFVNAEARDVDVSTGVTGALLAARAGDTADSQVGACWSGARRRGSLDTQDVSLNFGPSVSASQAAQAGLLRCETAPEVP